MIPILIALALAAAAPPTPAPLAIVHATAWTMRAPAPIKDATIVIVDGRIVSVEPHGAVPSGVPVVDAENAIVTPGLMNAATQLGLTEVTSATDTRDMATKSNDAGDRFYVDAALNGNSTLVELARADGVTEALSYPSASPEPPYAGIAALVRLRPGVDILDKTNAALFVVIGGGAWDKGAGSRATQWQILEDALHRGQVHAGDEPGGPHRGGSKAIQAVLDRIMPLAVVTHRESDIVEAIRLQAQFGIHVVIVGGSEAWRQADALAAAKIPVVLDPLNNLPTSFDQLGARLDNAALLQRAGVTVAFGMVGNTIELSYNAGMVLREGAGTAVRNGLPYFEGLKAMTTNPAAIWGRIGDGTLTPGAAADLVIWDGEPMEPATNAKLIVIDGIARPSRSRQDLLVERYKTVR